MPITKTSLKLTFHGRVLDHLGIQMYQSPTAALAELISNAWDADAEEVRIALPTSISPTARIVVKDTGNGMTFEECETRFLNVGYDCRAGNSVAKTKNKKRPLLGRKGIGKFAGFGIASTIQVDTTSQETGERTVFELELDKLRGTEYIEGSTPITVSEYDPPDVSRKSKHGTTLTLRNL